MNEDTQLVKRESTLAMPASPNEILHQVQAIQGIMRAVMHEGVHYGVIPGTGDKKALFKPGAEKLALTFRLRPDFSFEKIDLGNGHREVVTTCILSGPDGNFLGKGIGSCSTFETKYRYRSGPKVLTDKMPPKAFWDLRKSDPKKAQELIGGIGYIVGKDESGTWRIGTQGEKIDNPDIADQYNTVLKMSKKRSYIDAIITVTGCGDIFTQDVLDEPDENGSSWDQGAEPAEGRKTPGEASGSNTPRSAREFFARHFSQNPKMQSSATGEEIWRGVESFDIKEKDGVTNGKPWKVYTLETTDGRKASTFDSKIAEAAANINMAETCEIRVKPGRKQGTYELLGVTSHENEERPKEMPGDLPFD